MPRPVQSSPSSDAVLATLVWLRKQGFKPVPLHPASKAAISRAYVDIAYVPPDDEFWKRNDYGIGVVTGPAHSGPVDIDVDCVEAVHFAAVFLPPTPATFGRDGKPRSHYLYRVDVPSFSKHAFNDPRDETCIIEMRGDNGHQTVLPGSIHEGTGQLIRWENNLTFPPEVQTVSAELLIRAVQKVALAVLVSRHIWQPGYHNSPAKHLAGMFAYLDWPEEEAVEFVQALMDYSGDKDKSRVPTVRNTYKRYADGKKVSGAGVLRKEINDDKLVDRLLEWAGSPTVNMLQEYNDRYAVVPIGGKFRIADTDVRPGEQPVFYSKEDFLNLVGTDTLVIEDKPIQKGKLWLANPRRRAYKTLDFLPGVEDADVLNLWTGWAVKPAEGTCDAWQELVAEIVCGGDADLFQWLTHWFANIVREPMDKSLTAPVVIGVEGAGKSLMLNYFGAILGPAYVTVTKEEHIVGRFNNYMGSTLLLHSEEALYGGDKKHAGIIRSLITDPWHMFEQKGVDAKKVRNYIRLVLTSNDAYAAPAKPGDRRYTVIDMGDRKASPALIEQVLHEFKNGGPAALFHTLMTMPYDPAVARINVKNESLLALKSTNLSPVENWWLDTLTSGMIVPDMLNWATRPEKADWPEVVGATALHVALQTKLRERNIRSVPSETTLMGTLEKFTATKFERGQRSFDNPMLDEYPLNVKMMNGRQQSVLNLPPLDFCRAAFEKYVGQQFDWPQDDDSKPRVKNPHERF